MPKTILDTSVLIGFWQYMRSGRPLIEVALEDAIQWGRRLARERSAAIVTPVCVEFVAGVRSSHELRLARAYLAQFQIIDNCRILKRDWTEAQRMAERVPRDGRPRQLGDCLIKAIADRLNYDVDSSDEAFPT
jgi:predicted nucleic acid-binding protein